MWHARDEQRGSESNTFSHTEKQAQATSAQTLERALEITSRDDSPYKRRDWRGLSEGGCVHDRWGQSQGSGHSGGAGDPLYWRGGGGWGGHESSYSSVPRTLRVSTVHRKSKCPWDLSKAWAQPPESKGPLGTVSAPIDSPPAQNQYVTSACPHHKATEVSTQDVVPKRSQATLGLRTQQGKGKTQVGRELHRPSCLLWLQITHGVRNLWPCRASLPRLCQQASHMTLGSLMAAQASPQALKSMNVPGSLLSLLTPNPGLESNLRQGTYWPFIIRA